VTARGTGLSLRGRRALWLMIGAGLAARLIVAAVTNANTDDLHSFDFVRTALREDPLHVYQDVPELRWPYPSGYFPFVALCAAIDSALGIDFRHLLRLGPVAADIGLAALVQHLLGMRGASERTRLAGAALVLFGPVFFGVSAYQGQLDPVAILPALAAFVLWQRDGQSRALHAGLLIGLGASVKTVPLLMVLALAPSARSLRELVTLATAAAAVPVAMLAPFLIVDAGSVIDHLRYRGFPGLGGLSLVATPQFPLFWQADHLPPTGEQTIFLLDHGDLIAAAGLIAAAAVLARFRPDPLGAAAIVWLAVWVFGVNFFVQYLVWGLPFLLARGQLRAVAAIQALAGPAVLLLYLERSEEWLLWSVYTIPMIALWVLLAVLLARTVRGYAAAMPKAGAA
jgi:uncharacterized membrane protein